jgi:hypothetical protein
VPEIVTTSRIVNLDGFEIIVIFVSHDQKAMIVVGPTQRLPERKHDLLGPMVLRSAPLSGAEGVPFFAGSFEFSGVLPESYLYG